MDSPPPPAIVAPAEELRWEQLPPLPDGAGVAGAFVGVLGPHLAIGGGAAFPDGKAKTYTDRWHLLEPTSEGYRWVPGVALRLARARGYGATLSDGDGLILLGGCDLERCFAEVTRIGPAPAFEHTPLPELPVPLANFAAARVGTWLVVAGGQESPDGPATAHCYGLDLASAVSGWITLPAWPGPARVAPVGFALGREFFLVSGRAPVPGRPTATLTDTYALDLAARTWRRVSDVGIPVEPAACVMAATAIALDSDRAIVLGGGADAFLRAREQLEAALTGLRAEKLQSGDAAATARIETAIVATLGELGRLTHPGFQRAVRLYDRRTDCWSRLPDLPFDAPPVTTTAVWWHGLLVLPSGEIRPQTRTTRIWAARARSTTQ